MGKSSVFAFESDENRCLVKEFAPHRVCSPNNWFNPSQVAAELVPPTRERRRLSAIVGTDDFSGMRGICCVVA